MLYVLFCEDKPDSQPLRLATRNAHLDYVKGKAEQIRMAGPMLSKDGERMVGSLFIVEADEIEVVHALHRDDPYTRAGLWGKVAIHPFRQVLPQA